MARIPQQCTAKSKRSLERCRRYAPPGQTVCSFHGAKNPGAIRKAQERIAQAEAVRHLELLGVSEPVSDPVAKLAMLASEAEALLQYARGRFVTTESVEWLVLYGQTLGQVQKQLESLAKLLPAHEVAKEQAQREATDEELTRIVAAVDAAMSDPEVALTAGQTVRAKMVMAHALDGTDAPPARAGLRGGETAVSVLKLLRQRGPGYAGWSEPERQDADALWRLCASVCDTHGLPVDVIGEATPAPVLALPEGIADAELVEEVD